MNGSVRRRHVHETDNLMTLCTMLIMRHNPIKVLASTLVYLSTWSFLMCVLHAYMHTWLNLPLLSGVVFGGSMYISYVKPGYITYEVDGVEYRIHGHAKHFLDVVGHIMPFIAMAMIYGAHILVYLCAFNPCKMYGLCA